MQGSYGFEPSSDPKLGKLFCLPREDTPPPKGDLTVWLGGSTPYLRVLELTEVWGQ